jgi:glucan endo-1,3-alpha-glucosidase
VFTDPNSAPGIAKAFEAADQANSGFKLFFSFDYSVVWTPDQVNQYLAQYTSSPQYFLFNGLPFVSTFEGVNNVADWAPGGAIRGVHDIYFVPSWTSVGPSNIGGALANIDGFFSWDM